MDNPHTTAALLKDLLPGIDVKMDVGHVLFSRLSKSFDKSHESYSEWRVNGDGGCCISKYCRQCLALCG